MGPALPQSHCTITITNRVSMDSICLWGEGAMQGVWLHSFQRNRAMRNANWLIYCTNYVEETAFDLLPLHITWLSVGRTGAAASPSSTKTRKKESVTRISSKDWGLWNLISLKFQGALSNLFELSITLAGAIFVSTGARGSSRKEDLRPPSSSNTSTQLDSGSCSTRSQADRIRGCGSVSLRHENLMCDVMSWTLTSPIQRVAVIHIKSVGQTALINKGEAVSTFSPQPNTHTHTHTHNTTLTQINQRTAVLIRNTRLCLIAAVVMLKMSGLEKMKHTSRIPP